MSKEKESSPRMMGHGSFGGHSEKAKDFRGTMQQLFVYLKPYYRKLIMVLVVAVLGTIFMIVGPKILGNVTTVLAEGFMKKVQGIGGIDFSYILKIMLFLLTLYIFSSVFTFIQQFVMSTITQKVSYQLRNEIAKKINRLPFSYFDQHTYGDILSRVSNDVDTLAQSLNQSLSTVVTSIIQVFGILIMMFTISWQMTTIALVTIPCSMLLVMRVVKYSQKYYVQQQALLGQVNGHIEEVFAGHTVVKVFHQEQNMIEKFQVYNHDLHQVAWKSQFLSGLMQPLIMFVGNIGYVIVCLLGGYLTIKNQIQIGDIQAFIQYMRNFNQPIMQMGEVMNLLQSTAAAAERVFEFLNEEEQVEEAKITVPIYDEKGDCKVSGQVTFENVCFGYQKDQTIIHNFSMYIKSGMKVAIVGPTGAGKSTIIKLLMRFYELNSGNIYIDGINITDMKRSELRSLFGMVLQDTWLFQGSVMENLRYGKLDASDEEVIAAAKAAYVDHFIRTLEDGYHTVLNEESDNVSSGQKQLLTIARAFLANPRILILDEATSSVDTRTEILIQKGMEKLMQGRTSFVIAHRLSTIQDADVILVLKDGNIVEVGNHEELLKKQGFYQQLYQSQFDASTIS